MVKWNPHYTGIETWQWEKSVRERPGHFEVYLQRDKETKRLQFIRMCWPKLFRSYSHSLGLFKGRLNLLPGIRGFEIFTNNIHVGFVTKYTWQYYYAITKRRVPLFEGRWSGSISDPYRGYGFRIWRFGFGLMWVPKWITNWKQYREERKWYEEMERFEADHPEYFQDYPDEEYPDEEPNRNKHPEPRSWRDYCFLT